MIALSMTVLLLAIAYRWGGNIPDKNVKTKVAQEKPDIVQEAVLTAPEEEENVQEPPAEQRAGEKPLVEKETKTDDAASLPPKVEEVHSVQQRMIADKKGAADKYNTDSVPEGKPLPIEPQTVTISDKQYTCILSVRCDTALENTQLLDSAKIPLLPSDGVILPPTEVTFYEGESVFNLLLREMKKNKIHMEYVNTPIYNSAYIEGINNLYEFDCGELSGWMYKVNGWFPNYGCSRYQLRPGDSVEWVYTCNLGRDIGEK